MVGEDAVRMSVKELKRVHVIRQAMDQAVRQREAGEVLGVTTRQVRRLIQRVRAEGDGGLVHRRRGRPSNRRSRPALKAQVLRCIGSAMGILGRRWRRRSWPSGTRSHSARRRGGGGCEPWG